MADDQQKKYPPAPTASSPTSSPPPSQAPKLASPAKGPLISRRAFLIGAAGVSTVLTAAALAPSVAPGILNPLIPPREQPVVIANAIDLESKFQNAISASEVYVGLDTLPNGLPVHPKAYFSEFFYWPYSISDSPYYKNIIVRLPDDQYLGGTPSAEQYNGQTFIPSPVAAPTGGRFVAYNTTCVHLQCLVNPGYAGVSGSGQFRLICPCHGSQYNLADGVPVAGPAHDLGLNPLPKVGLSIDNSGNITATSLAGTVGLGRTSQ